MSGILMMVIAIVVLGGAYLLYGRYLQNKWGIDPKAKTPIRIQSITGSQPKIAAWIGPLIGPAPAMDAN